MATRPPPDQPQSVVLSQFDGIKNTVAPERLGPKDLERALNVDLDDSGQLRRRRGYELAIAGDWHSVKGPLSGKSYGVKDGVLGIIRPGPSFFSLGINIGAAPVCYAEVAGDIYFSSASMSGVITVNETVQPWGMTDGQGFWDSPVYTPTDTLGAVAGKLLGDPPKATAIEAFHGRMYLASDKMLWRTEVYRYHYVDRTKGFYPFEDAITMVMAANDGIYVGTVAGLYFLSEERILMREFGSLKLQRLIDDIVVLPGSGVYVPGELVRPGAMESPSPAGTACVFYTSVGIMAAFDGGEVHNLTTGRVELPGGVSAAGLFRRDQGANTYVAAVDSAGGPTSIARFGDFIDAEIIRAADRVGG